MKAIVRARYGSPDGLEVRDIEKPVTGDNEVLVRVQAASINAADWHLLKRFPQVILLMLRRPLSRVAGYDMSGRVEAVGAHVTRFKIGDDVFGAAHGAFAEYAAATEDHLALKPGNLTFEQAAAIPGAGCSALQGLRDKARVRAGDRVLIYGAGGGVGTFAVQVAKSLGAHVTAVTSTSKMDLLRSIGADAVIDYTTEDFVERDARYDVLFDLGADRAFADRWRVLTPSGKLVLCGAPSRLIGFVPMLMSLLIPHDGRRPVTFMARVAHADLDVLRRMAEAGQLLPVIDRRYSLSEVRDAMRHVGTRQARGKVVMTIGETG